MRITLLLSFLILGSTTRFVHGRSLTESTAMRSCVDARQEHLDIYANTKPTCSTCETHSDGSVSLVCNDECEYCHGSKCTQTTAEYGWDTSNDGELSRENYCQQVSATDQVLCLRQSRSTTNGVWTCQATVDGQECASCEYNETCRDNILATIIDCTNVEPNSILDDCQSIYSGVFASIDFLYTVNESQYTYKCPPSNDDEPVKTADLDVCQAGPDWLQGEVQYGYPRVYGVIPCSAIYKYSGKCPEQECPCTGDELQINACGSCRFKMVNGKQVCGGIYPCRCVDSDTCQAHQKDRGGDAFCTWSSATRCFQETTMMIVAWSLLVAFLLL